MRSRRMQVRSDRRQAGRVPHVHDRQPAGAVGAAARRAAGVGARRGGRGRGARARGAVGAGRARRRPLRRRRDHVQRLRRHLRRFQLAGRCFYCCI